MLKNDDNQSCGAFPYNSPVRNKTHVLQTKQSYISSKLAPKYKIALQKTLAMTGSTWGRTQVHKSLKLKKITATMWRIVFSGCPRKEITQLPAAENRSCKFQYKPGQE